MTLLVLPFVRRPDSGEVETIWPSTAGHEMAGPEFWRTEVWGSDAVRGTGAVLLPQLATSDLYVETAELDDLEAECIALRERMRDPSFGLPDPDGQILFRVENCLRAVTIARNRGGGVYIG